jgi:site-specific DNA-methyltransferase (adenine-specific)
LYKILNSIGEVQNVGKVEPDTLINADCLEAMKYIPDNSVDAIIADPPYGTTACKWDSVIPFEPMWEQLKRIIKPNGAIILTASQPFTSALVMSNVRQYKHCWVWDKKQMGNFANAKYMPLQIKEDIVIFSNGKVNYYPQMRKGKMRKKGGGEKKKETMSNFINPIHYTVNDIYYPVNILGDFPNCSRKKGGLHPTQKPVALMEYLIKTYTLEGEIVLDFTAGSFTTGVAAKNLNRKFIGIEKDEKYFEIGKNRIINSTATETKEEIIPELSGLFENIKG